VLEDLGPSRVNHYRTYIKDKLMQHLLDNSLIKDTGTQHGFMPGKSCSTNLTYFMDKVTKAVDEGKAVDIVYLDFAKAFDKVPRQRLLNKLRAKGVDRKVVSWIENWLSNRTQNGCIQGEKSESCNVDSGVPQGTVLGPILFTVYIDNLEVEIVRRVLEVLIVKFADDTKGAKVIESISDRDKLQEALDCLCDWADKWGMAFNISKCKIMHVGRNNPEYEYTMRGTALSKTDEERDIGVTISKNMKPSTQ
jgi:retron-type reverse transcriptase